MNYPKVTIMIPTYNQEEYIAEAIESALAQDYPNLEVVVTDDCSTDNTGAIAQRYQSDHRFRYIRNEHNLGRVGNYHNTAHNIASGDWLINLDGDDYFISTTFITDAMDMIISKQLDIVAYCYRHNISKIERFIPVKRLSQESALISGRDYFLKYYNYGGFGHANIIYRKNIGERIGMYILPYQACDFHSLIRQFIMGNMIIDNRTVSYWRAHGGNCTIHEAEQKQEQAMKTFDAIEDFASKYFSKKELKQWRESMNKASKRDYVITLSSSHRNIKTLRVLLSNFKFKYIDFRLLLKQLTGI